MEVTHMEVTLQRTQKEEQEHLEGSLAGPISTQWWWWWWWVFNNALPRLYNYLLRPADCQ